jgi:hypothetical protein
VAPFFSYPHCPNIWIYQVNTAYRREVVHYLDLVRTTYTGRRLQEFISLRSKRSIIIEPISPSKGQTLNQAYSAPALGKEKDAYGEKRLVQREFDLGDRGSVMIPELPLRMGTGIGADFFIEYHPATWRQRMNVRHRVDPGAGPGEMLFHEMIHCLRGMSGKYINTTLTENLRMDSFEEFCAVLAANIYRQERGFKRLKESHRNFSALPTPSSFRVPKVARDGSRIVATKKIDQDPDLSDPVAYYEFYKAPIGQWFDSQREFCIALALSAAPHNPFRVAADRLGIPVSGG